MKLKRVLAGVLTGALLLTGLPVNGLGTLSVNAEEGAEVTATDPSNVISVNVAAPVNEASPKDAELIGGGTFQLTPGTLDPEKGSEEGYQISPDGITGQVKFPNEKDGNKIFNITGRRQFLMRMQLLMPEQLAALPNDAEAQSIIGKMDEQYGMQITHSQLKMFGCFDIPNANPNWYEVGCDITDASWYGKWHDVIGIYDGEEGVFVLYVDGVRSVPSEQHKDRKGALRESNSSIFSIGYNAQKAAQGTPQNFTGKIKDISMYIQQEGEESFIDWKGAVDGLTDASAIQAAFEDVLKTETPELSIGIAPPPYDVVETKWIDASGRELGENDVFDIYQDYTVQVKIQVNEDQVGKFSFEEGIEGQINGIKEGVNAERSADGSVLTLTYEFKGQDHPYDALGTYLTEMDSKNEDESGNRKYTVASWNALVDVQKEAVALYNAGKEEGTIEEFTSKLNELKEAVAALKLAAENCECEIGEIEEPTNGSAYELTVDVDGPKTEALPGTKAVYRTGCMVEGHADKEPVFTYALDSSVQNTAEGTVDAEKKTLTVQKPGTVGVTLTVTLGDQSKSIKLTYTVKGAPVSDDDKAEVGNLISSIGTDYPEADKDLYSKENWDALQAAIAEVQRVTALDAPTKQELQAAKTALEEASARLKGEAVANVANAAKDAETLHKDGQKQYPNDLWTAFTTAYANATAAESVLSVKTPTELKKLVSDLNVAKAALENYKPTTVTPPAVQLNEKVPASTGTYQVTDLNNKTVKLVEGLKTAKGKVTIPATIDVKGTPYKVTAIGAKAFSNNKEIKSVVIGANVTSIESQAFSGCAKMTAVTIGANVKTIGAKAFFNCKKLKKVTLSGKKAPKVLKNAFKKTASKVIVTAKKIKKKPAKKKLLASMKKPGGMSKKSVVK